MPTSLALLPIFNALPGAYLLLAPTLLIEAASDAYLTATLTQRKELVGRLIYDVHPYPQAPNSPDQPTWHACLAQVLATGQPHEWPGQYYNLPDPAYPGGLLTRYWRARTTPVFDERQQVIAIIHALVDVAERPVELSEQQLLPQILGQVPAAIAALTGPAYHFAFFNDHYQALVSGRARLGRTVSELFPEVGVLPYLDLLEQVYTTGQPLTALDRPLELDDPATGQSALRYVDFSYLPLLSGEGHPVGVLAFIVDVTEKVLARQRTETLQRDLLAAVQRQVQAQATYQQVFEQTPAAICIQRGPEHRYEYVNQAYQQFFPDRHLLGRPVAEALPEIVPAGLLALLDGVYQTGETYFGHEIPLRLAQAEDAPNRRRYFTFTYQAYRENGEIVGISTFAYEVTEQVRARQLQQVQQQQLHEVFEQAPVAVCVFRGPDYVLEVVNPSMEAMWGKPAAQLVGRPFFNVLPELAGQGLRELLDGVRATGRPYTAQAREVRLAYDHRAEAGFFNFVYQPLHDEQGRVEAIACVATEVTALVHAQQASEDSAQQLRLLTDALPVLIAYIDRWQRYQFVNQAYVPWFGQQPANLLGRPLHEVVGDAAYQRVQPYLERVLAGERVEYELTMPYRPDFTRHTRGSLIPDWQQGTVVGFYTLISDVTDLVEARRGAEVSARQTQDLADELRRTNQQLTHTNVDLDNFIYTASHDLRAPITNLEGLLRVLHEQLPPQAYQQSDVAYVLKLMEDAVQRFQLTLTQLTDIARLQQAQPEAAEAVDLAALVENVRLDLAPLLTETNAQLHVDVATCPTVAFAPAHLRSVVYNLLSNALKYRHPDRPPVVHLRMDCAGERNLLEVQDNGLGLDEQQQARLFQLFQRLHTHVEGSGVGLYLVKRMVENAGGTLIVQSQPGLGSTFSVSLPKQAAYD